MINEMEVRPLLKVPMKIHPLDSFQCEKGLWRRGVENATELKKYNEKFAEANRQSCPGVP